MRILVTADLHYDVRRSREPARKLARRALREGGDVLVLVGDTAGADLELFREALALFDDFPGRKLLVAGNHDLWCADGENSLDRYESRLPKLAAECGFVMLDHAPQTLGRIGLLGSMGWYDYSLRDAELAIPLPFYRRKLSPGAARYYDHHDLLEEHAEDISERHLAIGARWMDGWRVKLGMSDEDFCRRLNTRLADQLAAISPRVDELVAFIHHLPVAELVPPDRPDRFAFAAAFLGAERFGQTLLRCEKLTHVYCGHSHWPGRVRLGGVEIVNVGSTYIEKHLCALEVDDS